MKKQIASALGVLAIAGGSLMGFSGSADAATASSDPTCTPQAADAGHAEVSHIEWGYQALNFVPFSYGPINYSTEQFGATYPGYAGNAVAFGDDPTEGAPFYNRLRKVVVDTPAVAAVEGVTCVAGEPQPKVLPIPGLNNDQIYENPSEQFVPHITGTVTRGWGGGTADITYQTDAGWVFADGKTEKVVIVDEINTTVVIPLPANPLTNCLLPAGYVSPADTDQYKWSGLTNHYALNGKVGVTVTAKPGYIFAYGNGTLASKVFTATCAAPVVTLSGHTLTIGSGTENLKVLVKQKSTGASITNHSNLAPGHYDVILTVKDESATGQRFSNVPTGWTQFASPTGGIFKISKGFDVS